MNSDDDGYKGPTQSSGSSRRPAGDKPSSVFRDAIDNVLYSTAVRPRRRFQAICRLAQIMQMREKQASMPQEEVAAHESRDEIEKIRTLYSSVNEAFGGKKGIRQKAERAATMYVDTSGEPIHEAARKLADGHDEKGRLKLDSETNIRAADFLGVGSVEEWVSGTLGIDSEGHESERRFGEPPRSQEDVLDALDEHEEWEGDQAAPDRDEERDRDNGENEEDDEDEKD